MVNLGTADALVFLCLCSLPLDVSSVPPPCVGGPSVRGLTSFGRQTQPSCCDPSGTCYSTATSVNLTGALTEMSQYENLLWNNMKDIPDDSARRWKRDLQQQEFDSRCSDCFPDEIPACRSNVTLLFPLSAVSVAQRKRVGVIQAPPLFVQPVIFNGCMDTNCRILGGKCNQVFVPQALYIIKKKNGVDTALYDFVYIEHGCECQPNTSLNAKEEKELVDDNLTNFVRELWNAAYNGTKNPVISNGMPKNYEYKMGHSLLNWTETIETKCGETVTEKLSNASKSGGCGQTSGAELTTTNSERGSESPTHTSEMHSQPVETSSVEVEKISSESTNKGSVTHTPSGVLRASSEIPVRAVRLDDEIKAQSKSQISGKVSKSTTSTVETTPTGDPTLTTSTTVPTTSINPTTSITPTTIITPTTPVTTVSTSTIEPPVSRRITRKQRPESVLALIPQVPELDGATFVPQEGKFDPISDALKRYAIKKRRS